MLCESIKLLICVLIWLAVVHMTVHLVQTTRRGLSQERSCIRMTLSV